MGTASTHMRTRSRTGGRAIVRVTLDRSADTTLANQIYESIRAAVCSGRLRSGDSLPSSRTLAHDLSVARSTVVAALEQLRAEGFLDSAQGRVSRISSRIESERTAAPQGPVPSATARPVRLSARAQRLDDLPTDVMGGLAGDSPRPFRSGVPALDLFPTELWGRLLTRAWRRSTARALGYGDPRGHRPLRAAIAKYLRSARGLSCQDDHVLICSGCQQAFDLVARTVADQGDHVWIEDPGYVGAQGAFVAAGLHIVPVPVDAEGLDVDAGRRLAPDARLVCVTPARQAPLGIVMSHARRQALLDWAASSDGWIFEDDYDSELQYAFRPPLPLQALDPTGRVILAGTFSKVLFPSLRLGYVVAARPVIDAMAKTKLLTDISCSWLNQVVLADFISGGHYERHIRRMRGVYRRRQDLLVRLLRRRLGPTIEFARADAGMNLVLWLPDGCDDGAVAAAARAEGLEVLPLSRLTLRQSPSPRSGLLLGFGGIRDQDLARGVERLAPLIRQGRGHRD